MDLKKGKGKLTSFSRFLDKKHGNPNTKKRAKFDEDSYNFVYGQILQEERRKQKITQEQLAKKVGLTKSYISRIETGKIEPSISLYARILSKIGKKIEIA